MDLDKLRISSMYESCSDSCLKHASSEQFLLRRRYCEYGILFTKFLGWELSECSIVFPTVGFQYRVVPKLPSPCIYKVVATEESCQTNVGLESAQIGTVDSGPTVSSAPEITVPVLPVSPMGPPQAQPLPQRTSMTLRGQAGSQPVGDGASGDSGHRGTAQRVFKRSRAVTHESTEVSSEEGPVQPKESDWVESKKKKKKSKNIESVSEVRSNEVEDGQAKVRGTLALINKYGAPEVEDTPENLEELEEEVVRLEVGGVVEGKEVEVGEVVGGVGVGVEAEVKVQADEKKKEEEAKGIDLFSMYRQVVKELFEICFFFL